MKISAFFFLKRTYTHDRTFPPHVCFCSLLIDPPLPSSTNVLFEWPQTAVDNKKHLGAPPTGLSKAFDCFSQHLLLAKLNANDFSLPTLRLMQSYLSNRKQKTKIKSEFSSWDEVLFGVPQGSISGLLLFKIFLCDLFVIINDVDFASYASDNTKRYYYMLFLFLL